MVDHPLRYRVVIKPVVAREAPYKSPDPEVNGLEKESVRDWKYVVSHRNVAEKKGGEFRADTANRFELVMSSATSSSWSRSRARVTRLMKEPRARKMQNTQVHAEASWYKRLCWGFVPLPI